MNFEWDGNKAASNKRKHDVDFEEASTALRDPLSVTGNDPDHSINDERFITSSQQHLLVVSHTERNHAIRIISARIANPAERKIYETA